ncbi:MAG: hypothetical protein LWW98_01785 [Deltaproteobacteria bacterium]|nr:hypothetical protein [Deltaproteobacteria bacterium]
MSNKHTMISPSSTKQEVTLAHDYIFRSCVTDETQGRIPARFAYMDLKAQAVVILKNINKVLQTHGGNTIVVLPFTWR